MLMSAKQEDFLCSQGVFVWLQVLKKLSKGVRVGCDSEEARKVDGREGGVMHRDGSISHRLASSDWLLAATTPNLVARLKVSSSPGPCIQNNSTITASSTPVLSLPSRSTRLKADFYYP